MPRNWCLIVTMFTHKAPMQPAMRVTPEHGAGKLMEMIPRHS
jgi:hypothetical protein